MSVEQNPYGAPAPGTAPAAPMTALRSRTLTIRRVDPVSVGKLMGILYALLGLIIGGFFSLLAVLGVAAGGGQGLFQGVVGGLGAIIMLPILYGVMGLIGGLIAGFLYNLAAGMVGGINLDLDS